MWCLEGDAMRCSERTKPEAPVALCRRMLASRHSLKFSVNVRTISGLLRKPRTKRERRYAAGADSGACEKGKCTEARQEQRCCTNSREGLAARVLQG
jgi:hypothetical protein